MSDTMNTAPGIIPEPLTDALALRVETVAAKLSLLPPARNSRLLTAFEEYAGVLERGGSGEEAEQASRRYLAEHPAENTDAVA